MELCGKKRVNDDLRVPGKLLKPVMRQSRCPQWVSPETLNPGLRHPQAYVLVPTSCGTKHSPEWRRYGDRGYVFGYIVGFDGMDSGQIVAQVVEGKVSVFRTCIFRIMCSKRTCVRALSSLFMTASALL